jgi:hypothetical protein
LTNTLASSSSSSSTVKRTTETTTTTQMMPHNHRFVLQNVYRYWRARVDHRQRTRVVGDIVCDTHTHAMLQRTFTMWRRRSRTHANQRHQHMRRRRTLTIYFTTWHHHTQTMRQQRHRHHAITRIAEDMMSLIQRRRRRTLTHAWTTIRHVYHTIELKMQILNDCERRWYHTRGHLDIGGSDSYSADSSSSYIDNNNSINNNRGGNNSAMYVYVGVASRYMSVRSLRPLLRSWHRLSIQSANTRALTVIADDHYRRRHCMLLIARVFIAWRQHTRHTHTATRFANATRLSRHWRRWRLCVNPQRLSDVNNELMSTTACAFVSCVATFVFDDARGTSAMRNAQTQG